MLISGSYSATKHVHTQGRYSAFASLRGGPSSKGTSLSLSLSLWRRRVERGRGGGVGEERGRGGGGETEVRGRDGLAVTNVAARGRVEIIGAGCEPTVS